MLVGGIIGILFVTLLRRVMVEDRDLPFPESVAASEIHKAGRGGNSGAKFLFTAMGIGAVIQVLKEFQLFAAKGEASSPSPARASPGHQRRVRRQAGGGGADLDAGRVARPTWASATSSARSWRP